MMYSFICDKCKKRVVRAIPINDYDTEKDRQYHLEDGGHLTRLIEFDGMISGGGDGWFGKSNGGTTI